MQNSGVGSGEVHERPEARRKGRIQSRQKTTVHSGASSGEDCSTNSEISQHYCNMSAPCFICSVCGDVIISSTSRLCEGRDFWFHKKSINCPTISTENGRVFLANESDNLLPIEMSDEDAEIINTQDYFEFKFKIYDKILKDLESINNELNKSMVN